MKRKFIVITLVFCLTYILTTGCSGDDTTVNDEGNNASVNIEENADETEQVSTQLAFYQAVAETVDLDFTIPDNAANFINEHPDFFPGSEKNTGAMSDFIDSEVNYPKLVKNTKKYAGGLMLVWGDVIDIEENEDGTLTYMQIGIENENYIFFYPGTLDDVFQQDYVSVYGLPFDKTTFENMGGNYTEAVVGAACYVEKWGDSEE